MKDLTTTSTDLFNKIRSRFSNIKIGDQEGAITNDPSTARFFDFNYKVNEKSLGRVNIKIDENSLVLIYNESMLDQANIVVRKQWYDFLREIRQFARSNLLTFDTRDITKSNLEKRDYQYLSKNTGEKKMSESKLFGTSKTSYQDIGNARIIVKHSQPVNYNVPAGRTQHIDSIYIESANGERFKYPFKHLNGARALAIHVSNGGNAYDQMGTYISGLSEELSKLRQFKNYTQRSNVMSETLGDITSKVIDRIDLVKTEIANLQKQSYYESFVESFKPQDSQEVPEEMVNQWVDALTIKTFNEELKSVFPYIYKLVAEKTNLDYEDLVGETDTHEIDQKDDTDITEHSLIIDFENQLESIATPEFEKEMYEEECDCDENTQNPCEDCQDKMESSKHKKYEISQEVVEFVKSMYDKETGKFPKGAEGVKIAAEKRFGEQAGRFAHYVVEKLSNALQLSDNSNIDEAKTEVNFSADDIAQLQTITNLEQIKQAAFELISKPSKRPMNPEKVEWFKQALAHKTNKNQVIKLMYDLLLAGEGHGVIGNKPTAYTRKFGGRESIELDRIRKLSGL